MRSPPRQIAIVVTIGSLFACADATTPTRQLHPAPGFNRIHATDSLLAVSNVAYSDTGEVMHRLTALAAPLSASSTIGPAGGRIAIPSAGALLVIPPGALVVPTAITMTAVAGPHVAYEFQPHGLVFALPVMVQQSLAVTAASQTPTLLKSAHGGYYDTSLDVSFIDPAKSLVKLLEHELGYVDLQANALRFFIGHFSGYVVTCGRE